MIQLFPLHVHIVVFVQYELDVKLHGNFDQRNERFSNLVFTDHALQFHTILQYLNVLLLTVADSFFVTTNTM